MKYDYFHHSQIFIRKCKIQITHCCASDKKFQLGFCVINFFSSVGWVVLPVLLDMKRAQAATVRWLMGALEVISMTSVKHACYFESGEILR